MAMPISLADYRGKVVLLDFWAVWCGPCLGEIPRIKAVYEEYYDKGFDVIGVSFDEDAAVLREFIKEKEDTVATNFGRLKVLVAPLQSSMGSAVSLPRS